MKYIRNTKESANKEVHQLQATGKTIVLQDNRPNSVLKKKQAEQLPVQKKANNTGLPDNLKSGIENLSGQSMDDVKVHYNSSQPAQLNAHAYAQGNQIHIASGQEKHLPHEAWHVVQQKQGRVKPTKQLKGKTNINDDAGLEKEADVMGSKALQAKADQNAAQLMINPAKQVVQRLPKLKNEKDAFAYFEDHLLEDIARNMSEIEKLETLATKEGWDDLLESINYHLRKYRKKEEGKKAAAVVNTKAGESEMANWIIFNGLDKKNLSSLSTFIQILERAQKNDWRDLEEAVLPVVRKLEDYRDFGKGGGVESISVAGSGGHKKSVVQMPESKKQEPSAMDFESNKSTGFEAVFQKMLATTGKQFDETRVQEFLKVALSAHDMSATAANFTRSQFIYQHMLIELGLSRETIMNFNRSAGYEYEFSKFYEQGKIGDMDKGEVLRSHVLLAMGTPISEIFGLGFRLETDSHNSLEMVTPPFLFLVTGNTKTVLKQTHDKFQQAVMLLKGQLELSSEKLISSFMGNFEALGFGPGWKWELSKPLLCATNMHSKHGGVYGQVNVSLSPTEIIHLMPHLMKIEKERSGSQQAAQVYEPSKPMALFNQIFPIILKHAGKNPDAAMNGTIALYARSVSNILGMPSVLYRNILKDRPEKGNYATDVKETLGIWVKDFSSHVIYDYIKTNPSIKDDFVSCIKTTEVSVWEIVQTAVHANLGELFQNYMDPHVKFYETKGASLQKIKMEMIAKAKEMLGIEPGKELPAVEMQKINPVIIERSKNWDTEKDKTLKQLREKIGHTMDTFLKEAQQEYRSMVGLLLDMLTGKEVKKPRPTRRDEAEVFGEGLGVRKETYLGQLPGNRNLRVAELRNSDNLAEQEQIINK